MWKVILNTFSFFRSHGEKKLASAWNRCEMMDRSEQKKRFVAKNEIVRFFFYIQLISAYRNLMELNFTIFSQWRHPRMRFFPFFFLCDSTVSPPLSCDSTVTVFFFFFLHSFIWSLIRKLHISFPILCHQRSAFRFNNSFLFLRWQRKGSKERKHCLFTHSIWVSSHRMNLNWITYRYTWKAG